MTFGSCGGLMVSTLDSRLRGLSSKPGQVNLLCSCAIHFPLTVPLSTQEYKWVLANCQGSLMKCWGLPCDGLPSLPGGSSNIPSCFMLHRKLSKLSLAGPTGSSKDFTFKQWPATISTYICSYLIQKREQFH